MGIQNKGSHALVSMDNKDVYYLSVSEGNRLVHFIETAELLFESSDWNNHFELRLQVPHVSSVVFMGGRDNG